MIDPVAPLRQRCAGSVLIPGDPGFDDACRLAWAPQVPVAPAVVVQPASAADVAAAVRFATSSGLPLTVIATGHGTLIPVEGGMALRLDGLTGVSIDPARRTARLGGGVTWAPVLPRAQAAGLAPLVGSALGVGAVGYSLGGGIGWLARANGYAADQIEAATVVLASGEIISVNSEEHPDLLWALRGGGGNFGVVTELVTRLVPVTTVYGGSVIYPLALAPVALPAFAAWVGTLPPAVTASFTFMRFPDLPAVPAPVRGQATVIVRACATGDLAAAAALVAPMRQLGLPIADSFRDMSFAEVASISNEPAQSVSVRDRTLHLDALDDGAMAALLATIGPDQPEAPMMVDLRYVEGAAAVAPPGSGCANRHPAPFVVLATSPAPHDAARAAVDAQLAALAAGLAPATAPSLSPNFVGASDPRRHAVEAAYLPADLARLRQVKTTYDPANLFRPSLNIHPLGPAEA